MTSKLFRLSTYLHPKFGLDAFPFDVKDEVLALVKAELEVKVQVFNARSHQRSTYPQVQHGNKTDYVSFRENYEETSDPADQIIKSYSEFIRRPSNLEVCQDALTFWRLNEFKWPELGQVAKKYLGVPASSASVERMFSISGHLNSNKRRKTGTGLFCNLVFLKLNEEHL